jgi:CheY-like chemotaxis protein
MESRPRVLVVDDSQSREGLRALLEAEGYDVTGAPTGAHALALAEGRVFDAVLVDLGLPKVEGLNLVHVVRSRPDRPVMLVFTGYHRLKTAAEVGSPQAKTSRRRELRVGLLLAYLRQLLTQRRDEKGPKRGGASLAALFQLAMEGAWHFGREGLLALQEEGRGVPRQR